MTENTRPLNTWDMVKNLALLFMFIDHAGAYFFIHDTWIRSIGRGAAPIYLFLGGFSSSYRFSREIFALACFMWASNAAMGELIHPFNILFTILLSRAVLEGLERRGKRVERPLEWFISLSVFILITCVFFQYGTLGLMFAVAGYMHRRPERYTVLQQRLFLAGTFAAFAGTFAFFFDMGEWDFLLMVPVLVCDYLLLSRLQIHPVGGGWPRWLREFFLLGSRYSAYIYAFHLIALSWITGYPI